MVLLCRGRIGIALENGQRWSSADVQSVLLKGLEPRTLPILDVCALTAANGVCSGSGASMSGYNGALSAFCNRFSHSKKYRDNKNYEEEGLLRAKTYATSCLGWQC